MDVLLSPPVLIGLTILGIIIALGLFAAARYKRCPPNKLLVIYGKTGGTESSRCLHGGGGFVWPIVQDYDYLSLLPMTIDVQLKDALSKENVRIDVPSSFTVAIGKEKERAEMAAVRLLGMSRAEVVQQAEDVIFGQLRQVIASMTIEQINRDREEFSSQVRTSLEPELNKLGLVLVNVNIKDIQDASGYIEATGRKAAAEAVQAAAADVAEQERAGQIRVAAANRDKEVEVAKAENERLASVAEIDRDRRIATAAADAAAVASENEQEASVAKSEAVLYQAKAEAQAAAAQAKAVAEEEAFRAQGAAEIAKKRAAAEGEAEAARLKAEIEAKAQAEIVRLTAEAKARAAELDAEGKAKAERLEAEGEAARIEAIAKAEADRIRLNAEAEAARVEAIGRAEAAADEARLRARADGVRSMVEACGSPQAVVDVLLAENAEKLAGITAEAIKGVEIDSVTVYDRGDGGSVPNFLHGLLGSVPQYGEFLKKSGVLGGGEDPPKPANRIAAKDPKPPKRPDPAASNGVKAG